MNDEAGPSPKPQPVQDEALAHAVTRTDASGGRRSDGGAAPRSHLGPGDRLGRYLVIGELGKGGAGVVLKAYDSELDRPIAIKVLHANRAHASGDACARLIREGQAIAQLNHENVVSVYDVGMVGDEVFIAMEYVAGETLQEWMRRGGHSADEILDVFVKAGRGLLAAHDKDLIHRDFKPHNVLIGSDGRVKVVDFGLARSFGDLDSDELQMVTSQIARSTQLCETITRTGFVLGTPAYMAPEQHRAGFVDERTDQFAYCVALYEALYGSRPFPGNTYRELSEKVLAGAAPVIPRDSRVPGHVRQILLRGLSMDADRRYPSMRELLDELTFDAGAARRHRRNLLLVGIGFAALGAIAAFGFLRAPAAGVDCDRAGENVAGVWSSTAAAEITEAFGKVDVPYAAAARERTVAFLGDYARTWAGTRRQVCVATHERGEQSSELLDVRMACLDQRLSEMRELVSVLRAPDASIVARSAHSVQSLRDPSACATLDAPDHTVPRPTEPAVQARISELRQQLDRAKALYDAHQYDTGVVIAREVVEGVRPLAFAPLLAEALVQLAELEMHHMGGYGADDTLSQLREAVRLASSAGETRTVARAWILLAALSASLRETTATEAGLILLAAESAVARVADDGELRAAFHDALGVAAFTAERWDQAEDEFRQALAIREGLYGPDDLRVADSAGYVAYALMRQNRHEESRQLQQRGIAIYRAVLGPDHPLLRTMLTVDAPEGAGRDYRVVASFDFEDDVVEKAPVSRVASAPKGGWFLGGRGYLVELTEAERHGGRKSAHLAFREKGSFGVITREFPVEAARGKWLRLTGYIKTRGIERGHAGLWGRVDGPDRRTLAFDNMAMRGVRGTTEWTRYYVELAVPPEAVSIYFGALLSDNGEAWIDDLSIEISEQPLPEPVEK